MSNTFIFTFTFTAFIALVMLRLLFPPLWKRYHRRQRLKAALQMIHSRGAEFDSWLQKHNFFYRNLDATEKRRFMQRTVEFMRSKQFLYYQLEKDERMALLVSSAAVQISFGLRNYLMDYFKTIHILKGDYRYGSYKKAFMGHVNKDGIHFSWYNFMKGFEDYNDAHNVGLHEMAHALDYINFIERAEGSDPEFKERFREFSGVAKPIFKRMQDGETNILDAYAATDFQEFWAVSVETFFEKSKELKAKMPTLYESMSRLLNLDPLAQKAVVQAVP